MKRRDNRVRTRARVLAIAAALASASALGAGADSKMLKCNGETIVLDRAADGSIEGAFGTLRLRIGVRDARGATQPARVVVELVDEAWGTGTQAHTDDVGRTWDAVCGLVHEHVERLERATPSAQELAERLERAYEALGRASE